MHDSLTPVGFWQCRFCHRIQSLEAQADPDAIIIGALKEKLATLPKEKVRVVQEEEPKDLDPEAAAKEAAALELAKQRRMRSKSEWETKHGEDVDYWKGQRQLAANKLLGLGDHGRKTREAYAAALVITNARIKILKETAEASVSTTKLAGLDRDSLTKAWDAQLTTLTPEAALHTKEFGQMLNNLLLHTNFLQLSKTVTAVPLVATGSASSGANAGGVIAANVDADDAFQDAINDGDAPAPRMTDLDKRPLDGSEPTKENEGRKKKGKTQDEIDADEANKK